MSQQLGMTRDQFLRSMADQSAELDMACALQRLRRLAFLAQNAAFELPPECQEPFLQMVGIAQEFEERNR